MIAAVVELGSLAMVNDHLVKRRVHLDSSQKPWRCELIDVPFCDWHDVSVAGVSSMMFLWQVYRGWGELPSLTESNSYFTKLCSYHRFP